MSKTRLLVIAIAASCAVTSAQNANRRVGQTNITVPVPADPHELVTGGAHTPANATERGMALAWMQQTIENTRFHQPAAPSYRMDVTFTANGTESGQGNMTEVWLTGQSWRWNANLGAISTVRGASSGSHYADSHASVPMSVHMVRNAIFSPTYDVALGSQLRVAAVKWNNKPATCVLSSGVVSPASQSRLWEEVEYCFDNANGLLEISSFAPGSYTVYGYDKGVNFHGHPLPDAITIFEGGKPILDATFQISDAGPEVLNSLGPTPDMTTREAVLQLPSRQPINVPNPQVTRVQPVIVHANVVNGQVVSAEAIATSNPQFSATAVDFIKGMNLGQTGGQQQMYLNVKFIPPSNPNIN
jgi:hypothetical protein